MEIRGSAVLSYEVEQIRNPGAAGLSRTIRDAGRDLDLRQYGGGERAA